MLAAKIAITILTVFVTLVLADCITSAAQVGLPLIQISHGKLNLKVVFLFFISDFFVHSFCIFFGLVTVYNNL